MPCLQIVYKLDETSHHLREPPKMKAISDDEASETSCSTERCVNTMDLCISAIKTDQGQRIARSRERNREHARRTRLRKKALLHDLQLRIERLEAEKKALRQSIEECSIASILLGLSGNSLDEDDDIVARSVEVGASASLNERKCVITLDASELVIKVNGVDTVVSGNGKAHVNWRTGVYTDDKGVHHHLSPTELALLRRERNRKHARHTRLRKKAHLDSIQQEITRLEEGNRKMRDMLSKHSPTLSAVVCSTSIPENIRLL